MSCCHCFVLQAAFDTRVKTYNMWQSSQQSLSKKREQEQKLTATGKIDKLQVVKAEIEEVGVVSCHMILSC